MKRVIKDIVFMVIAGLLLWSFFPDWFGVNPPWRNRKSPSEQVLSQRLKHPDDFSIHIYAKNLRDPRALYHTDTGDLLVSIPSSNKIILLSRDKNNDGAPDAQKDLLTGLNKPHGMDIHNDWLYVAETDAIGRIRFDPLSSKTIGNFERIITDLPSGGRHWTKTVRFGPDGWMYISIGSSCDVCVEDDPRRATIMRFCADGSNGEIYAGGLRNTVGFDWHPDSQSMYGVDNGRDYLGDNFPPCELNLIERGNFYGWPYANGDKIPDPDFGKNNDEKIGASIGPVHSFKAHRAPLDITFLSNEFQAAEYRNAALITLHGSWNSSKKVGYKVVSLRFDTDGTITQRPFLSGFEENGDVIGRPVDIVEGANGTIFLSDDHSGTIYQLEYNATP